MLPSLVLTAIIFSRLKNDIDWFTYKVRILFVFDAIFCVVGFFLSLFEK